MHPLRVACSAITIAACLLRGSTAAVAPQETVVKLARRVAAKYTTQAAATAAGFVLQNTVDGVEHWQRSNGESTFDPNQPDGLVYLESATGPSLVAVFYLLDGPDSSLPSAGGDGWHRHTTCFGEGGVGIGNQRLGCPPNTPPVSGPAMLHVWLVTGPWSAFDPTITPALYCTLSRSQT